MRHLTRVAWLAVAVFVSVAASGCGGLVFRTDTQVKIETPKDLATVKLPFDLRWSTHDLGIRPASGRAQDSGRFGIFVDTAPMPPGQSLRYFARNDQTCLHTPGCPDATYLAPLGVFTTTKTRFTVQALTTTKVNRHRIDVVLLNARGVRIGESFWSVTVFPDSNQAGS